MAFKKLNKAIKRTWVKALRSGRYNQARGVLFYGDIHQPMKDRGFCCIALGYAVSRQNGFTRVLFKDTGSAAWSIGLDKRTKSELLDLNDDKKWGFRRIATWIEKNL